MGRTALRAGDPPRRLRLGKTITTLSELDRIAGDWRALEARCTDPLTYFQGFD